MPNFCPLTSCSQRMYATLPGFVVAALTPPDRTKRVKDARSEAQKEIEEYRKEKEEEFQKFEKEVGRHIPPTGAYADVVTAQLRQQEG